MYYGSRPNGIGLAVASPETPHGWKRQPGPVLGSGPAGAFDAAGVNSPEVVAVDRNHWHMYYVGYHPSKKWGSMAVHQIGLAESDDAGATWRHASRDPVIPSGAEGSYDAFSTSSASVLRLGNQWYLWYGGIMQVPYLASICLALSNDGHTWRKYERNPVLRFDPYYPTDAFVVAKPHVLFEERVFKMWYSARGLAADCRPGEYRVCYAESRDGIHWDRFPKNPVLTPSSTGWDQKMVEYAEVLHQGGKYHMWYCGDRYGSVGYAEGEPRARIRAQARTGMGGNRNLTWTDWKLLENPEGSTLDCGPSEWIQLRMELHTEDPDLTPVVQDVAIRQAGSMQP